MFDKLKQIKKLRDLQKELGKEVLEVERDGTKVTLNGHIEVESIQLNAGLEKDRQEKVLKDCINDAVRKMQMKLAQKMGSIGGFGL